jgi:hypothetical protein
MLSGFLNYMFSGRPSRSNKEVNNRTAQRKCRNFYKTFMIVTSLSIESYDHSIQSVQFPPCLSQF